MLKYILLPLTILILSFHNPAGHVVDSSIPGTDTIPGVVGPPPPLSELIFEKVEVEAEFPGGVAAWSRFLAANLNSGLKSFQKAAPGSYTVMVQFIVDKNGKISNITPLTNHGFGLEQEVIRVIKKSPRWLPAVQGGKKVKAYRRQPVIFALTA